MSEDFVWIDALAGFGLGLAAGLLAALLPRNRGLQWLLAASATARRYSFLAVGTLAILSVAALIGGRREPAIAVVDATPTAGSMEAAIAELNARLATKGGLDADWQLLAQSYDFLGRTSDAELARQHRISTERSLQDAVAVSARMLGPGKSGLAPLPSSAPGGVAALLAQAEQHRRKREFKQACDVYAVIVMRGGMTADTWADYADAQAGLRGKLSGEPARAIAAALAADPKHPKALWLQASLAHEERRYGDALRTWQQLLALVPKGSSDARIVTANIAEATRLASN